MRKKSLESFLGSAPASISVFLRSRGRLLSIGKDEAEKLWRVLASCRSQSRWFHSCWLSAGW